MKKKDFTGLSDEECREMAIARVYRSLAASEQSSKKLARKMESEGYPEDSIRFALDRAESVGALDDARYCEMLIRSTIASGKGIGRCLREIEELGVDPETLEAYQEYLEQGIDGELERAIDFLERHPTRAKDKRGAAFRKLVSRGYSTGIASQAASEYFHRHEV